jgi:quercetin dioxygenase-like cupin family protein
VAGITVRILRTDPQSGGMTMVINIPPGWAEPRSRHHDCVEESFKLSGDIWLEEDGRPHVLSAGDYFFRPPRIKHGPMRTEGGTSSLIRFSGVVVNHYGPL